MIGHCQSFERPPQNIKSSPFNNNESPESRGFRVSVQLFCFNRLKPGTHPAIPLTGDSFHHPFRGPWYRQAGDSPLYTGLAPLRDAPTLLGSLVQAGRGFPLYTGLTLLAKSSLLGALIQAGQGFPLLLLPEMDLQPPAVIDLAPGPVSLQRPRRQHRQQQPTVTCSRTPVHVLAVELELAFLRPAFSLKK